MGNKYQPHRFQCRKNIEIQAVTLVVLCVKLRREREKEKKGRKCDKRIASKCVHMCEAKLTQTQAKQIFRN